MADKVKQVALEEAERVKSQTVQAARSAAYLYPLRVRLFTCGQHLLARPIPEYPLNQRTCRAYTTSSHTVNYGKLNVAGLKDGKVMC